MATYHLQGGYHHNIFTEIIGHLDIIPDIISNGSVVTGNIGCIVNTESSIGKENIAFYQKSNIARTIIGISRITIKEKKIGQELIFLEHFGLKLPKHLFVVDIPHIDLNLSGTYRAKRIDLFSLYWKDRKMYEKKIPPVEDIYKNPEQIVEWKQHYAPSFLESILKKRNWVIEDITLKLVDVHALSNTKEESETDEEIF